MKVIIAGGRDYEQGVEDVYILDELYHKYHFTEVVCGEAKGADQFGKKWALHLGIKVVSFPANWKDMSEPCVTRTNYYGDYNALAGHKRNELMAEYADAVILFFGGRGTEDMRKAAMKHGLKILYDEEAEQCS